MLDSTTLSIADRQLINSCLDTLESHLRNTICFPTQQITGRSPLDIESICQTLKTLTNKPAGLNTGGVLEQKKTFAANLPLIKRAVIQYRRCTAPNIQLMASHTVDGQLRAQIEEPLQAISRITEQQWFKKTKACRLPKLTDFVKIDQVNLGSYISQYPKKYDDKFGILFAANQFQVDLQNYRNLCELRGCPISIAYLDIDDFKRFNTDYNEPTVDREILPKFMTALEAHMFYRGSAYRFGGDEYVALLPNTSGAEAAMVLNAFQKNLKKLEYPNITDEGKKPTVSIGICELNDDCLLTGIEAEERAAHAKEFAKKEGKNKIANFKTGFEYGDHDLEIVAQG